MYISEDGTVTGSINVEKLKAVKAKTAEAKAELKALRGDLEPLEVPEVETIDQDEPDTEQDEPDAEDVDALRADAEAKGLKVDKRWGAQRLREEIQWADEKGKS